MMATMRNRRIVLVGLTLIGATVLAPGTASACPVCYGALEGPIADAVNLAIFALLGVTLTVLGGFAAFFIHLAKRARALRREQEWREDPAGAGI